MAVNPLIKYKAITREQFLFHEMRTIAKLIIENKNNEEIINEVVNDNLFQYPTEKSLKEITRTCLSRLRIFDDNRVAEIIATGNVQSAKQACLFAMMEQNRLVWDFMVGVIGEKYKTRDYHFSTTDINSFFTRLQEQNDDIASWSEASIKKCKQVLMRLLLENEYLENRKATQLNSIYLDSYFKSIVSDIDSVALCAFNSFE